MGDHLRAPASRHLPAALVAHVDTVVLARLRRREEAARLLAEYEAEHGEITPQEIEALASLQRDGRA